MTKLSEEYFFHLSEHWDVTDDRIKTYGLIREIEGKIEALEFVQNNYDGYQDIRTPIKLFKNVLNPELLILKTELTTIRKEAGL